MDVQRLKESFARVAMHGDEVPLFFFSDLFLRHPETRDMFPVSMTVMRDRLVHALARIVSDVDNLDGLTSYLRGLGRDHRKFGTIAEHYPLVGTSLLATLAHFNGPDWTPGLAADWRSAYDLVAQIMITAAREDEGVRPPFWEATVIAHELRRYDISVFRIAVNEPLAYRPGQSVSIESEERPRLWRLYSMANAPRDDLTMDFHVRMIDGGALSMVLTRGLAVGSRLKVGPPLGSLVYDAGPAQARRDVLLVGGSTGLAPLKAIVEQMSDLPDPPQVHLFFGARTADGLYDLADLEKMAAGFDWLTAVPVVSHEPGFAGEHGQLPAVVARSGTWREHDAYVSGPSSLVEATVAQLTAVGVPPGQIHVEDFGWSEP
ncbi:MAG TPA: globin domain-containing protein [Streptosporangiaceae bacterium]